MYTHSHSEVKSVHPTSSDDRKLATKWAGRQFIKSRSAKQVLRTMAWMASSGVVAVSHQTLMRRTGYCRRSIVAAVQWLASKGLIEVEAQRGYRGRQAANRYTLNLGVTLVSRVQKCTRSRVQNGSNSQSAKIAPLYTEVVTNQDKNEPRDIFYLGDTYQDGDTVHCTGWWPPPTDLGSWSEYDAEVPV